MSSKRQSCSSPRSVTRQPLVRSPLRPSLVISSMGSSPSKKTKVEEFTPEKIQEKWAEPRPANNLITPDDSKILPKVKRSAKVAPVQTVTLTKGVIQDYINLEKSIYSLEKRNVIKKYESQTIFSDDLKNTVEQLEAVLKELKKQTDREKNDLQNVEQSTVKDYLKQQGTYDARHKKEKEEFEDALKRQLAVEKELKIAILNHDNSQKIQEIYKKRADTLMALYDEQEKLLEGILGNDYASEKENILEGEVDEMIDWQQRVSLAMFKWANGRVLLVHALTQLTFGINRWQDLFGIEKDNQKGRYFAAAEARNNFVAATQNILSCRMYLNKVEFPYGTESDVSKLEETISTSFKNLQDDSECKKALKVYEETQKKVAQLIQWFDKVINETIRKDLDQANNELIKKQKSLREERLILMKKIAKKELDEDIEIDYDGFEDDDDLEKELQQLKMNENRELDQINKKDVKDILGMGNQNGQEMLPLNKLAPIPSKDALFGDVRQKLDEHGEKRKQFEARNNLQREKQAMALQEKLKLRQQKTRKPRKDTEATDGAVVKPRKTKKKSHKA